MKLFGLALLFISLVTALPVTLIAQNQNYDPTIEAGFKPFQSYDHGVDSVNLATGNLNLLIPLISFPQRGGQLHVDYYISYNSLAIQITCPISTACYWTTSSGSYVAGTFIGQVGVGLDYGNPLYPPDGSQPKLGWLNTQNGPYGTLYQRSLDGSGIFVTTTSSASGTSQTVVDQRGLTYSCPAGGGACTMSDTNGNELLFGPSGSSSLTDTLGRQIPALPSSGAWTVPGPNNQNATYQIGRTAITLPDLKSYSFSYKTYTLPLLQGQTTAQQINVLNKITFPSGGSITYGYPSAFVNSPCNNGKYYHLPVTSRSIDANDGAGLQTTTYNYNNPSAGITLVQDALGDQSFHTFTVPGGGNSLCFPYEGQVQQKDSQGHLLKTVSTQYSLIFDNNALWVGPLDVYPTNITTTWPNGQQASVAKSYDRDHGQTFRFQTVANQWSSQQSGYTSNPWSITETDYSSTVLRVRNTVYQAFANPNYFNANNFEAVSSTQIQDNLGNQASYVSYGYDEYPLQNSSVTQNKTANQHYPGNQTSVHRWLSNGSAIAQPSCNVSVASGGYLVSTVTYFDTGEVQQDVDPCLNSTSYLYALNDFGAYPTTITNALGQSATAAYDFNTGRVTSTTDLNMQPTTKTYDIMGRLSGITYPDGGSTSYCYTDIGGATCNIASAPPFELVSTKAISSTLNETSTTIFDGLNRVVQTQLNSDPSGTDYMLTTYDGLGRKSRVYNPTRCATITTNCANETTWGYSTFSYDALGRVTSVLEQDGSSVTSTYSAFPCTTTTDEAGISRQHCEDALGRLIKIVEAPSTLSYETDYLYSALSDLTKVTQKGSNIANARIRSFQYDSLSRLQSSTNAESGNITYLYDADGNVVTKTAPSPNQAPTGTNTVSTMYTYDTLNRLTGKSYNDQYIGNPSTPSVAYGYDGINLSCSTPVGYSGSGATNGIGRRTAMCFNAGSKSWQYDSMGRIFSENDRFIGLVPPLYQYNIVTLGGVQTISTDNAYAYYLNGDVLSLMYPGQGIPAYRFSIIEDAAGRISSASDVWNNSVVNGMYTPDGQLASALVGATSPYGGSPVSNTYNNRLQPVLLSAATATGTPIVNLTYNFNLGNGTTGSDNGNVIQIANGKDANRTQNFTYDALNRIENAYTNGANWGESYTIDAWSNLTNIGPFAGKTNSETLNCAAANTKNQLNTCFTYDPAGNLTQNGPVRYIYDAENHLVATSGVSYLYDGDGQRIEKCTEGSTPGTCAANATGTFYWRLSDGSTQAESDLGGNWTASYGFIHGQIAERVDLPANSVKYYFQDRLNSTDVITDSMGVIQKESDYYPYGGEISISGSDNNSYKFTGKERDAESGLDNFGARHYASTMGRFMTPDWSRDPDPVPYADYENPQTLNLYQYVENNPLNAWDPDGHAHWGPCPNDSSARCWTGDQNGEVDQNNGTVWNGKRQQWEQPQAPPSSSWQQFLSWRQNFINDWNKRIDAHRPPPQKQDEYNQFLQNINNLMMGMVPYKAPLARDITGKIHEDIPDHVPDNWTKEDLETAQQELKDSINQRNVEQSKYGEEGGHRERIRQEEHLLRQVEKKLGGS